MVETVAIFAVAILGPYLLVSLIITAVQVYQFVAESIRTRRAERIAAVEDELDRKQAQLRSTILTLASELNGNALEARKALIRESFLARGEVPKD